MFESDVIDTATNGHIDSELLANGAEPSSAYPPAAVLSGPMPEQLEEINQLITDLEQATQAKHASVTMLRGKLAVSQQQLDAKAAELEDLREEAERSLEQLQSTQAQLEEQVFNLKEAREENASANLQLHQVKERLDAVQRERQEQERSILELQDKLAWNCDKRSQMESNLKEAREENELVLLQLHQVQEELEVIFLEQQKKEKNILGVQEKLAWNRKRRSDLELKLQIIRSELSEVTAANANLQADYSVSRQQLEEKVAELAGMRNAADRLESENKALLSEVHATQRKLESLYQKNKDQSIKLDWNREKRVRLESANNALIDELHATQRELESCYTKADDFKQRVVDYSALLSGQRQHWLRGQAASSFIGTRNLARRLVSLTYAA